MTALRNLCDPDVVMHHPEGWPEPGPSVGGEALLRQWEQIREAWTGDTLEPVTDLIAAADRVVVRDAWRGSGQGPDADMEFTRVFTLRERKISASTSCLVPCLKRGPTGPDLAVLRPPLRRMN